MLQSKKILLISERWDYEQIVGKVCRSIGFELRQARDKEQVIQELKSSGNRIELIVLDLDAAGASGIETLKKIRVWYPNLPVIVLSAFSEKQVECECLLIDAFILKPCRPDALKSRILFVLEQHSVWKNHYPAFPSDCDPSAKILIANEKEEVCKLLCVVLTEDVLDAHFEVAWGCSGEEVLNISQKFKPDIGIVDIRMPDMWGHELIGHFKAGKGRAPKDYVIYSNFSDPEQRALFRGLDFAVFSDLSELEGLVTHLKALCFRHQLVRAK